MLPTILNLIGLVLDITGVLILFYSTSKGLTNIRTRDYPLLSRLTASNNSEAQTLMNELVKNLNESINKSNQQNERIFKKSKRWLILIIAGFALQLIASILTLVCNHPN